MKEIHDFRSEKAKDNRLICNTYVVVIKFIYSEKATKFCKIFILLLSYVVPVKSKVKISQNFVAFSEYFNFNIGHIES